MSEVILIGDRAVGKTKSVVELIVSEPQKITVLNLNRRDFLSVGKDGKLTSEPLATSGISSKRIEIEAALSIPKRLIVDWVDTRGEWNSKEWQENTEKSKLLRDYQNKLSNASAIIVMLRPYRTAGGADIRNKQLIEEHWISNNAQWCKRFRRWVEFINLSCPKLRYVNFCLNKADLYCSNLDEEAKEFKNRGWQGFNSYIYSKYFFQSNNDFSQAISSVKRFDSVRFFITSTYNRTLLEMPWLYLATYL
jgi:hypothetical protein